MARVPKNLTRRVHSGSIWGSMKVQEGSLVHIIAIVKTGQKMYNVKKVYIMHFLGLVQLNTLGLLVPPQGLQVRIPLSQYPPFLVQSKTETSIQFLSKIMYSKPARNERFIRSNYRTLYGSLIYQGLALTLCGSALLSLESIGLFWKIKPL